jgi:uncharacterized protein YraI
MKRLLAIASGLFLLAAIQPANATDGWASSPLNLRSGAATSYDIVTVIPYCAKFDYYSCSYGWCEATWSSYKGYVSEGYIRHDPCQAYTPPQPSYTPPSTGYKPPPRNY